jgi:hypothetical protein
MVDEIMEDKQKSIVSSMAKVVWREKALLLLEAHLDYALAEFGRKTVGNNI